MNNFIYLILSVVAAVQVWYVIFLIKNIKGWKNLPVFEPSGINPNLFISIVIAARNEEENIGRCINSLLNQSYPLNLFEIIIVDDGSEDNTFKVSQELQLKAVNIKVLSLEKYHGTKGKKAAIHEGVNAARGALILTTDADCVAGKDWIKYIAAFYSVSKNKLIASPVIYEDEPTVLGKLQLLEFTGLIGLAASSIQNKQALLCNGANLAFERDFYLEVAAHLKADEKASGDDMFLLIEAKKRYPDKIGFIKSKRAAVITKSCSSISLLVQQRRRWVSKGLMYNDKEITLTSFLVYSHHFCIFVSVLLSFIYNSFATFFLLQLLLKLVIDFAFLFPVTSFFYKRKRIVWILPLSLIYSPFVVIIGVSGLIGTFEWKGRRLK